MRLLISWVRDFVDVSASPAEIAETLALRGFEVAAVENVESMGAAADGVIDFEVTANRPDCLSVAGLAREIATAYDLPFLPPSDKVGAKVALAGATPTGTINGLGIAIEDADLCPRYAAAVADVVDGVDSPAWLVDRLKAAGVRPISPIVDITNYVLMEMGHPLHAFDLARLAGPALRIRRATAGESITTLDGVKRPLEAGMLVIADAERPQAVAGVMGGGLSEMSGSTRTVVFESAYFTPASIRRTSKRLNLKTEASSRFERGTDINAPVVALRRAIALMQQIGAGRLTSPIADVYPAPRTAITIRLRQARLLRLLGLDVPAAQVVRILTSLGLDVKTASDGWDVTPPTSRVDLLREVDLIEEVGRHYGFDRLEPAFPALTQAAPAPDPRVSRDQLVRKALTAAGFNEAITFGFVEAAAARAFVNEEDVPGLIDIANPLSAKFSTLRPSLLPGLVDVVAHNRRHGRRDVAVFEIGARFQAKSGETRGVAMAWTGGGRPEHWSGNVREVDFFDIKGSIEQVCSLLGVPVSVAASTHAFLVPGQTADIRSGDVTIGVAGLVSAPIVETRGAPRQDKIFVAELNLDTLSVLQALHAGTEQVRALPRYPFVVRDLSIVVSDTLPAEIIRGTIQTAGDRSRAPMAPMAPLINIAFFDRYKGKDLGEGTVSVSVRLTFQATDRTLTDAEVQQSFDTIVQALVEQHSARQR